MIVIEKEVSFANGRTNTGQGSGYFYENKRKEGIETPSDHRAINILIHLTKK